MFGSYERLAPEYYQDSAPDGPFQSGSRGWSQAPWVTWGDNPNQAGPRRVAVDGLGSEVGTRCNCEMKTVGEERKLLCDCQPHAEPPPPPPFWQSQPHWFFRQYVRSQVAPWGTGPRAFDVPRRAGCPTCYGNRNPTSGLGSLAAALGATTWNDIPWWCWQNADGSNNATFNACKDAAVKSLPAGATEQQRIQAIMNACYGQCRAKPAGAAVPATSTTPSSTTPSYSVPATTTPATATPARNWTSYLPELNTTTLAVTALVGVAAVVLAQQKGWL